MAFAYKGTFTVTGNSALLPASQTNFPLLVSVTDNSLKTVANGGQVQNTVSFNGHTVPADVVFHLASNLADAAMSHDVAFYDGVNGILEAWVLKATLALNDVFYCGIGDAAIVAYQGGSVGAAWNSGYKIVYHCQDNAATKTILDSTANGNNATNVANTSTKTATGEINAGLTYDGTSDAATVAIDLSAIPIITFSFWMKWTTNANDDKLVAEYTSNFNGANGALVDWNSSGGTFQFGTSDSAGHYWTDTFTRPSAGSWHLVHLVMNRTTPINIAYVDGASQSLTGGTHNLTGANFDNTTLNLMSRSGPSLTGAGILDETHLYNGTLTANWVTCEYNNQSAPGTFIGSSFASNAALSTAAGHGPLMAFQRNSLVTS